MDVYFLPTVPSVFFYNHVKLDPGAWSPVSLAVDNIPADGATALVARAGSMVSGKIPVALGTMFLVLLALLLVEDI